MSPPRGLVVIVCGAGPAGEVGRLVGPAQQHGWDVGVIATPAARAFLDCDALEEQIGQPVRSECRRPDEPRNASLPRLGGMIVAPATLNTLVK